MRCRRSSEEELKQIETYIEERLTSREIGEAGIRNRNLRYRKRLTKKGEDETKALFKQRNELRNLVWTLQGRSG